MCMICEKHRDLKKFTGEHIAEKGGWVLTHFPFLTDEKATRGHLILETKRHITDLAEMNEEESAALGELTRTAVHLQETVLKAEHVYMFRINDKVAHLHIHLIPRYPGTPREYFGFKINEWPGRTIVNLQEIQALSSELRTNLQLQS